MKLKSWNQIEALFLEAVDLSGEDRARLLDHACAGNPELRAQVDSLLANDPGIDLTREDPLALALAQQAAAVLKSQTLAGERLGSYRLIGEIGRGGMGAVYVATRDDDQYRKTVAIKVVKRGMDTADVLRRFRHERQILAGLEHPYIARLLDGGGTGDGRPFLVMELVEGQPIDQYCNAHDCGIEERCRLFLKVCEAVSYAHRKLVAHRDLKPANILIAADGSPKLLDFGLAKILDTQQPGTLTATALHSRPLTPDYASPEQIRGQALTTATDVYSLGVILHELLTGTRPHRARAEAPSEWEKAICETEIAPPSESITARPDADRWRRRMRGDLDNIVMMAMRKEVDRRYTSVDQFANDIRNYLASRPVHARQDSVWYRTARFARRRRYPLLAAATALVSLLCGTVIAFTQAHRAEAAGRVAEARRIEAEKDRRMAEVEHGRAERERDAAVIERRRAEDRLAQIVSLSDRSLSDVYALIERLPGAVPARRELVATALDFLEKSSRDAGTNPRLRIALAKAYSRLGELQMNPYGDVPGALKSFQAGVALLDGIPFDATDSERLVLWLGLQNNIGVIYARHSDPDSLNTLKRALAAAERFPAAALADKRVARSKAMLSLSMARSSTADFRAAQQYATNYLTATIALVERFPNDADLQYDVSVARVAVGWVYRSMGDAESAAGHYEKALEIRESLVKTHPTDTMYQGALMLSYEHLAGVEGNPRQANLGHTEIARELYRKAQPLEEAAAGDLKNPTAASNYADFLLESASLEAPAAGLADSIDTLRHAAALYESLTEENNETRYLNNLASTRNIIARRLIAMARYPEAIAECQRASAVAASYLVGHPQDRFAQKEAFDAERGIVESLRRTGDRAGALEHVQKLIRMAQQNPNRVGDQAFPESREAQANLSLAEVQLAFGGCTSAGDAAREAIRQAAPLATGRVWDPNGEIVRDAQAIVSGCGSK